MCDASDSDVFKLARSVSITLQGYHERVEGILRDIPPSYYPLVYGMILCVMAVVASHVSFINVTKAYPARNPILFCKSKNSDKSFTLMQLINAKVPALRDHAVTLFNPLLFSGNLQTMFAGIRKFRFIDRLYFGRQMLHMADGGSASLDKVITEDRFKSVKVDDCDVPPNQKKYVNSTTRYLTKREIVEQHSDDNKPMILALHGLSGSSAEAYCRCLFSRLYHIESFECFVLNSRGCGNTELTSPSLFCALWTEDIHTAVRFLKKNYPNRPLFAVGFSLGSVILTNYLAQEGIQSQIDFAVTLACIWDLRASSYALENGIVSGNLYSPVMTLPLLGLLSKHKKELMKNKTFAKNYTSKTSSHVHSLCQFDDYFTSQLFGFSCADEYYLYASPIMRMNNIRTPLLNINSEDDPIAGSLKVGAIPLKRAENNPYITIITTNLGGHLGWFKWNNDRWYADPVSSLMGHLYRSHFTESQPYVQVDQCKLSRTPLENDRLPVCHI
ncbi:hypothetical protein FOA43_001780 [Brettanomyces nanus]|uniref:AB hydrolase-1 domain-containing protein n=1 Tax=Eeniella nana TaxID=13502 RepID=A0A875RP22_EENNA|nr:uncharacterized protein FOA43_001780 [Brettanomyces nanus]QPG74450.1 hypothetical protein FOA43_001780 [Brettanomyces nanus]